MLLISLESQPITNVTPIKIPRFLCSLSWRRLNYCGIYGIHAIRPYFFSFSLHMSLLWKIRIIITYYPYSSKVIIFAKIYKLRTVRIQYFYFIFLNIRSFLDLLIASKMSDFSLVKASSLTNQISIATTCAQSCLAIEI